MGYSYQGATAAGASSHGNNNRPPGSGPPTNTAADDESPDRRWAFSVAEAAIRLGISERHLRSLISTGVIPSVRLGRRVLIPLSDLAQLLRGEEVDGNE